MTTHNHTTKGIRRYGQCPACDEYRQTRQWIPVQDEQARQDALQDSINAAFERLKKASTSYSLQQGVFVVGRPPFDPAAPLPPMRSHGKNPRDSWEPAARRYRDLTEDEKQEQQ